ncbi:hypothetical protein GOP47_0021253, partial [Adiantum capillus-veneris]
MTTLLSNLASRAALNTSERRPSAVPGPPLVVSPIPCIDHWPLAVFLQVAALPKQRHPNLQLLPRLDAALPSSVAATMSSLSLWSPDSPFSPNCILLMRHQVGPSPPCNGVHFPSSPWRPSFYVPCSPSLSPPQELLSFL